MKIKFIVVVFIIFFAALLSVETKVDNSNKKILEKSELLIDAFYSFDSATLNTALNTAESSKPHILFYQGWAEGGHYLIIHRKPCKIEANNSVSCSITVQDDLMLALEIDFNVTDTFHLSFKDGKLNKVSTSSNDLQVFRDAEKWVWSKHPEWVTIPCKGYFKGGPTPSECVRALVKGYAEFAKSVDFPKDVNL